MEAITAIVTALVMGAAAGVKNVASKAVNDGYSALKELIVRRQPFLASDLQRLEENPTSKGRQMTITEDLMEARFQDDAEILARAEHLIKLIRSEAPDAAQIVGIDLKDVESAALTLRDVIVHGENAFGIRMQGVRAGDIDVRGVMAGSSSTGTPPILGHLSNVSAGGDISFIGAVLKSETTQAQQVAAWISELREYLTNGLFEWFSKNQNNFDPQKEWATVVELCRKIRSNDHCLNEAQQLNINAAIDALINRLNMAVSLLRDAASEMPLSHQREQEIIGHLTFTLRQASQDFDTGARRHFELS